MADGGYEASALCSPTAGPGCDRRTDLARPCTGAKDGVWFEYTLAGERPVDPDAPVTHVSSTRRMPTRAGPMRAC